ncbi:MAG: lysophospholipid acyltransferase family protein [Planctomycetaceae bacterium]
MSPRKINSMDARKLRYLAEYGVFCCLVFCLRCLPVATAGRVADSVAWFVRLLPRRLTRFQVAADNIRTAFGEDTPDAEVDRIVLGMWQHLFRMVCEIIQLQRRFRLDRCGSYLDFYQRNECVQAALSGRPVLFLGGHFGNWEISVNTFGHFGFPMGVVARDLDNPYLHRWFLKFRESSGNWMISKSGAGNELVEVMEAGGMAALLCDQDAGRRGVFADFFGRPASTFKSIGLLALQYDALIVVGGAYRLPADQQRNTNWVRFNLATQQIIDSREFRDVESLTQQFTSALEDLIRKAPEQYFWVHRRWKTALPEKRAAKRRQAA